MDYTAFSADRKTLYAVLRALEVVGEAAKRVPDEVRSRHSAIDWRGMAGLRDIIIHQYDPIDYRVPFEVVTAQLPSLVEQLVLVIEVERRLASDDTSVCDS